MKHIVALIVVGVLTACSAENVTKPLPVTTVEVVSGADQVAGAALTLSAPVTVRILVDGKAQSGVTVVWRVIEGGGIPTPSTSTTDANGQASTSWTLGFDAGQQLLLATANDASFTIRATSKFVLTSITSGFSHSCALSSAGIAYCWGDNSKGQLGTGNLTSTPLMRLVNTSVRFSKIVAGWSDTCGIATNGELYCWGDNAAGQLGIPTIPATAFPLPVPNVVAKDVALGFQHTCVIDNTNTSKCWGSNSKGQLGAPVTNLKRISAGEFHTCAIRNDNGMMCWGWNTAGEVGIGSLADQIVTTPTTVVNNVGFNDVSNGVRHSCALALDNTAYCWGRNGWGETGFQAFINISAPSPIQSSLKTFSVVGTGNTHTCGLTAAGKAYCWGNLLGNGTTDASVTPVEVSGNLTFSALSVGYALACGISLGDVFCWDNTTSLTPKRVLFQ